MFETVRVLCVYFLCAPLILQSRQILQTLHSIPCNTHTHARARTHTHTHTHTHTIHTMQADVVELSETSGATNAHLLLGKTYTKKESEQEVKDERGRGRKRVHRLEEEGKVRRRKKEMTVPMKACVWFHTPSSPQLCLPCTLLKVQMKLCH